MIKIFPSLMNGDLTCLKGTITYLHDACSGFHIDIMDRDFVDNVTWGPDTINALHATTQKPFWFHLMTKNPEWYINRLIIQPGDIVSLHCEVIPDSALFTSIKEKNALPSIAINPDTPLKKLEPYLPSVEHILVMSVNPGFSGQTFIPQTFERLDELRTSNKLIGIDGGITKAISQQLKHYKLDSLALSSALFNTKNPLKELNDLHEIVQ